MADSIQTQYRKCCKLLESLKIERQRLHVMYLTNPILDRLLKVYDDSIKETQERIRTLVHMLENDMSEELKPISDMHKIVDKY